MVLQSGIHTTAKEVKVVEQEKRPELNFRLMLLSGLVSVIGVAAYPYMTLKLGLGIDLSMGAMFLAAALLGRSLKGRALAVELNMVQTMVSAASGVAFMCVILAAFYYVQDVFQHDIGFNPTWWQLVIWLLVSSSLGIFLGALVRTTILNDTSLPWPTGRVAQGVIETLSDPAATDIVRARRTTLSVTTGLAGALTYLRDGFGVIHHIVGNPSMRIVLGLELASIGIGMMIPLSVGLSGLLGVWVINAFGEQLAQWAALAGTAPEHFAQCATELSAGQVTDFLKANCGTFNTVAGMNEAEKYLGATDHFGYLVKWTMWPATAMMIAAALTSVVVPLVRNLVSKNTESTVTEESLADENVPKRWLYIGVAACVVLLAWLQGAWFDMPIEQVALAVALQPLLILAGLRVLGLTGSGPVSLMANATQFIFGLIWPQHIKQNLNAAHISADPQASSEGTVAAFWVARRVGGSFNALIIGQLIALAIGAFCLPAVFGLLVDTYGIGLGEGQLSAPTALKIASLAMVMEQGLDALPYGCMEASIAAGVIGIVFELLLMRKKRNTDGTLKLDENGNSSSAFGWVPIPSAFGFAMILPPSLSIGMAIGSMISAAWRAFSPHVPPGSEKPPGSYQTFCAPFAAGLVAGEVIVGGIVIPVLGLLVMKLSSLWS